MDRFTLRSAHPGLHAEIYDEGFVAGRELASQHNKCARAAGSPMLADRAIQNGWTIAEALPHYREHAGRSDATATALAKALDDLGLSASGAPTTGDDLATANRLIAKMRGSGSTGAPSGSGRGVLDYSDLVANAMNLPQPGQTPPASSAAATSAPLDNTDRVARAMFGR